MANQNQCSEIQNAEGIIGRANLDATQCLDFFHVKCLMGLKYLGLPQYLESLFYVNNATNIIILVPQLFILATTPEVASWPGPTCSRDILASFSGFRKDDLPWAIKNSSVSKSMA